MSSVELVVLDPRLMEWGVPRYHSAMAAAIDLHVCADEPVKIRGEEAPQLISVGFAIHINDPGLAALILPRSGLAHKQGLVLGNTIGLIDADYTGPVMVSVWNRNPYQPFKAIKLQPGERFAQLMFVPIARPAFRVVEAFSSASDRGSGGFGSTGR